MSWSLVFVQFKLFVYETCGCEKCRFPYWQRKMVSGGLKSVLVVSSADRFLRQINSSKMSCPPSASSVYFQLPPRPQDIYMHFLTCYTTEISLNRDHQNILNIQSDKREVNLMFLKKFLLTHEYAFLCTRVYTYSIAMPQCFPALSPAAWKPDRPIRVMVGVMVKGPMYFSRSPGRPSAPMHTSTMDDTMIAPWIWQNKHIIKTRTKRVQWHDENKWVFFVFFKWSITIKSKTTAVLNYDLLKSTTQAHEAQVQAV